jgi:hypothetical protein
MAAQKFYGFRWVLTDLAVKLAEAVKAVMGVGEVKVVPETNEVLFLAPLPDKRRQIDLRQVYSLMGQLVTDMTALAAHPFTYPFFCTVKELAPFIVEVIPDDEEVEDSPADVKVVDVSDGGHGDETA